MKKLATFVLFLCLGAFTIGPVVGCGGKDEKKEEKKEDAGGGDEKKEEEKKDA